MKTIDYISIGTRIRNARKNIGLSQEELAEKCNLSTSYVGHIERGSRKMSLETLIVICEALNVSADYLLTDDLPENDMTILSIISEVKKKGSYCYNKYVTILKATAEIIDRI